jgi:hypothetical protein
LVTKKNKRTTINQKRKKSVKNRSKFLQELILFTKKIMKKKLLLKKIFKIEDEQNSAKSKEKIGKRYENTSALLGQVKEKSYKRPAR